MKVIHTGTFDVKAGGPAMSTYLTMVGLRQLNIDVQMFMYPLTVGSRLRGNDVPVHYTKAPLELKFGYSPYYKNDLISLGTFDIYHAQGVWQYPTYALVDVATKRGCPYVITPRGMLYPQAIAQSSTLFKKTSLKLRLLKDLNKAACVQVTCIDEMNYCRELGVISPIAVIPNPIEVDIHIIEKKDKIFRLGYLGRLSPRKNVESLIYAFDELRDRLYDAELLIIGGGDEQYESFLKGEVKRLNLKNVFFTGFVSGEEKENALASLSVLAMPSEFENLGNVVLEGLVRRIPCIATKGSPWEELNTSHCGWWIDYNQESINQAVYSACNCSEEELNKMGDNGRILMINNYSVNAIGSKMHCLYNWILTKQNKPIFLYDNARY